MRLARKRALITRATRSVGDELARTFASEGSYVSLHGRETVIGEALAVGAANRLGCVYLFTDIHIPGHC
jgi:NAD(P)-dependent dehydrogenase (short-subunit alcohol dehydrogenase family)